MLQKIFKARMVSSIFALSAVIVAGGTAWAYFTLKGAASVLILHFNSVAGIDQIGGVWELAGIGATGLVVVAVNFLIALELEARDRFLGKLLAAVTLLLSIFLLIAYAAIISVN